MREFLRFSYFLILVLLVLIGAFLLPPELFDPYQKKLIFILGIVGLWRYSWFGLNVIRSLIY